MIVMCLRVEDESAELAFCESSHLAFTSLRMAAEARVSGGCEGVRVLRGCMCAIRSISNKSCS